MTNIVVFGSINMDVINRVHNYPLPGETVKGLGVEYSPGGKGANQAVAASKAGGNVTMLGAVGTDGFGHTLLTNLKEHLVDVDSIRRKKGSSGLAFITVSDSGENHIILDNGANGKFTEEDVIKSISALDGSDLILLQNEIPWGSNRTVLEEAGKRKIPVFFNPAPAMKLEDELLSSIQVLVLNETEAEFITGLQEAESSVDLLINKGVPEVVLTLGKQGLLYQNQKGIKMVIPAFTVKAVDTTAAGDSFIGALSSVYKTDTPLAEKLRFASAAAALTVTKKGAQNSIPDRSEIEQFLSRRLNEATQ